MKFTPNYPVMYGGKRHSAKVAFEISDVDAEEMKKHGTVEEQEKKQSVPTPPEENDSPEKPPAKRPGRPKKEQ